MMLPEFWAEVVSVMVGGGTMALGLDGNGFCSSFHRAVWHPAE
jgi:hypothetical protein